MTIGIKTVREICSRMPLVINEELLQVNSASWVEKKTSNLTTLGRPVLPCSVEGIRRLCTVMCYFASSRWSHQFWGRWCWPDVGTVVKSLPGTPGLRFRINSIDASSVFRRIHFVGFSDTANMKQSRGNGDRPGLMHRLGFTTSECYSQCHKGGPWANPMRICYWLASDQPVVLM